MDRLIHVSDRAGVTAEVGVRARAQGFHVLGPWTMNAPLPRQVRMLVAQQPAGERMTYVSGRQARKAPAQQERYRAFEVPYGFVHEGQTCPARWIVVHSDGKAARDRKTREKRQTRIERELEELRRRGGQPRWPMAKIQTKGQACLGRSAEGRLYEIVWEGPPEAPTGFQWRRVAQRVTEAEQMEGIYAAATTIPAAEEGLDPVFPRLKHQYVEVYAYVGIGEGEQTRWVPSRMDGWQREVYRILGIPPPVVDSG